MFHPLRSKRFFFFLFLLFLAISCSVFSQAVAQTKTTVAFLGFTAKDIPESGVDILSELVRNELVISPEYTVIDRNRTEDLLKEMEFQLSDLSDQSSVVTVGNLLGVQKVMSGTIGRLGELYIITLNIMDVETGAIERAETEEFVGVMEDLRKPVRIAVQKLLDIEGIEVARGTYIHVASEPEGVNIYIDGLFEGSAPARVKVPGPGEYHVKLYSPGYQEWIQKVKVEENATFFVNAKLLKMEKDAPVDERIRALQDGRTSFIVMATLYSLAATEALIYASGTDNDRLYFGLPLLVTPGSFFLALRATDKAIMNKGRSFMITSSMLWGSTMGFTSGIVMLPGEDLRGDDWDSTAYWRPYAFASALGGLAYGTAAVLLTRGDAFPARRVWFMNLGSFMGSLVGLGIPYMFHAESNALLFGCMFAGSTLGGALAAYLTRHISALGVSVENLSFESLMTIDGAGGVSPGIPIPAVIPGRGGGAPEYRFTLMRYSQ
ncbi:MAG: PEGA domain-containing protein [Spirochaetales bacterium]|nr:PEGA domain-containing protein [Spirochaetales bacterium]